MSSWKSFEERVMTSYVILSMFSVIFSTFYIRNRRVLEQLLMILEHLYCFLYLSHVILFFLKHSKSKVFWCNLRRNHANRQSKTSEDLWRLWKDQEWRFKWPQKTLQREKFCSQVPTYLIWKQTPKRTKKHIFMHRNELTGAPIMHFMHTHVLWA